MQPWRRVDFALLGRFHSFGVDNFNIVGKISFFPHLCFGLIFFFFAFMFGVYGNSLFFFFELVFVVWFVLMSVSWDWDIIGRIYKLIMEHALISIFTGFWMKKCIQTL